MRNRFDRQLTALNEMLIRMGSLCEDAISQTALALQSKKDALKMISDMERIGDQCADISDIVNFLNSEHTRNFSSSVDIQEMASATMKMVTKAVDSFVNSNVVLAEGVIKSDDYVDDLFMKVKTEVIKLISENPDRGEALLDILMIAKYFERIGDHATNVAEWVVFSITGVHKDGNTGGGPNGRTAPLAEA